MKRIITTVIAACIFFMFTITAYAETGITITESTPSAPNLTVTDIDWNAVDIVQDDDAQVADAQPAISEHTAVPIREVETGPQPINVETTTENGVTIVKKTFEYTPGLDPQTLAQSFEQDGYSFSAREILRFAASGELSVRPASKTSAIVSDTDDVAEVIELFPDTIQYEQDGYAGQLRLDSTSLVIEADDYETFTYPFTRTRDIPGLARNDPALIEREWDGMTLSDVSFRRGADGRYTATAVYRGMATGRRAASFVATVNYYGEVTRGTAGHTHYTVIYEGTPIDESELPSTPTTPGAPTTPTGAQPPAAVAEQGQLSHIIAGVVLLIVTAFALRRFIRKFGKGKTKNHESINETKRFISKD